MTSAFFLLVLLAFSDEIAYAASRVAWIRARFEWIYLLFDSAILALLLRRRRQIRLAMNRPKAGTVTWCWFGGAGLMLLADARWVRLIPPPELPQPWEDVVLAVVFAVAMVVLLATTIGVSPRMLVARGLRSDVKGWEGLRAAIPLLIGIFFAFLASVWWDLGLEPSSARSTPKEEDSLTVDVQFFAQASQVLPLLIVALGYELGTFREAMKRETQRAAAIVSLTFLCVGEVLALSVLVQPTGKGTSFNWHTYSAFVVVVTAGLIGLTTLVGGLLAQSRAKTRDSSSEEKPEPRDVAHREPPARWLQVFALGVITIAVTMTAFRRRE